MREGSRSAACGDRRRSRARSSHASAATRRASRSRSATSCRRLLLDAGTGLQTLDAAVRRRAVRRHDPADAPALGSHAGPAVLPARRSRRRAGRLAQPAQGDPFAVLRARDVAAALPDRARRACSGDVEAHRRSKPGKHEFGPFAVVAGDVEHKGGRTFGYRVTCDGVVARVRPRRARRQRRRDPRARARTSTCSSAARRSSRPSRSAPTCTATAPSSTRSRSRSAPNVGRLILTHHAPDANRRRRRGDRGERRRHRRAPKAIDLDRSVRPSSTILLVPTNALRTSGQRASCRAGRGWRALRGACGRSRARPRSGGTTSAPADRRDLGVGRRSSRSRCGAPSSAPRARRRRRPRRARRACVRPCARSARPERITNIVSPVSPSVDERRAPARTVFVFASLATSFSSRFEHSEKSDASASALATPALDRGRCGRASRTIALVLVRAPCGSELTRRGLYTATPAGTRRR